MARRRSAPALLAACTVAAATLAATAPATTAAAASSPATCAVPTPTFAAPSYVDTTRAGGEPQVATLPNGRLLYSSHAGTTHFFAPDGAAFGTAAFAENYTGQTYLWTSDNQGKSWQFRERALPTQGGTPASGFSDPEVAIDSKGAVYFSEINLANVAFSRSTDNATTFTQTAFNGLTLTDRQWMEGDRPGEFYVAANSFGGNTAPVTTTPLTHYIAKTTDGGRTFGPSYTDTAGGAGLGDIEVDKSNGTVYEAHYTNQKLQVASFRKARDGVLTSPDLGVVADGVSMLAHWPSLRLDPAGNIYITWDESGKGSTGRAAGVYFSYSTDGARTFAPPTRLDTGSGAANGTDIWPWLAVGSTGKVVVAWLGTDVALPNNNAETVGTHGWRIKAVETTSGLGCDGGAPVFSDVAVATPDPIHIGTICQGGTTCQAQAIDRRLGDYFSVGVDGTGAAYVGVSDTRVAGAVSLPLFVRQNGGPSLAAGAAEPAPVVPEAPLPVAVPIAGLLLVGGLLAVRRRRAAVR